VVVDEETGRAIQRQTFSFIVTLTEISKIAGFPAVSQGAAAILDELLSAR
jgi:hypothetical protein